MKAVPISTRRRTSRRALGGALAALCAGGLLLPACAPVRRHQSLPALQPGVEAAERSTDGTNATPTPTPIATPTPAVAPELRRYYEQELTWAPCSGAPTFDCALVTVPLDYAQPEGGDIDLAAIRKPAGGTGKQRIGSLQINPGGPGAQALEYLVGKLDIFPPSIRASYDLVAMDPRGIGDSTPVDCGPDPAPAHDPADIDANAAAYDRVAAACERHAGELLPHVGTPDVARDMDVLRALLGDDRLNYYGMSYGTYLGATYAEMFPSRVGRMVLDGAMDPALDAYRRWLDTARGYQKAWEAFAADCVTRTDCPVGHSVQEAARILDALRRTLNRAPLRHDEDTTVTGEDLSVSIKGTLRPHAWEDLRRMLREVQGGDTTTVRQYSDDTPSGDQAFWVVSCLSSMLGARFTPAEAKAALARFVEVSPQFGESTVLGLLGCTHWPTPANQTSHPITAPGAAPILVIGSTGDPATPYNWSRSLARRLSSGHLLTYDNTIHVAGFAGSACIDSAIDRYLISGRLPPAGKVCT
ncbi:alpha/beta hydrolase [Streptomyces sp. NPDC089795]|uniref:alpha/beta hydrolase n=1 Tax=Streptomyces sp. NPDC089795 TaxID=3155297 RepID=UPI003421F44C